MPRHSIDRVSGISQLDPERTSIFFGSRAARLNASLHPDCISGEIRPVPRPKITLVVPGRPCLEFETTLVHRRNSRSKSEEGNFSMSFGACLEVSFQELEVIATWQIISNRL